MFFVASSLLVLQPSFCSCCIYQSQMICDISAISTLSLSLHIFTCHQILIKRLIGLIYILLDIQKICVYRSLEGEYDYQSWSVKGIPGIVRDKGTLMLIDRLLMRTRAQTFTSALLSNKQERLLSYKTQP